MAEPQRSEIVSDDAELLILVDSQDQALGHLDKAACHDGSGILHRAFSLFIFNSQGQLLLQQRAANKRLWGGYWSNSCCSHPRKAETMQQAVSRRCEQELGSSTAHPMSTPPKSAPTAGLTLRNLIASSVTQTASSHLGCVWSGKR